MKARILSNWRKRNRRLSSRKPGQLRRVGCGVENLEERRLLAYNINLSIPGQVGGTIDPSNPVSPPDVAGDVGRNHFVQAVNAATGGSSIVVYNKSDGSIAMGPFGMDSLSTSASSPCSAGLGDPIVEYDHLADRWLLAQFATGVAGDNHLCVFVSQSGDILRNRWFEYDFATQLFPDYPKFGISPTGYLVSSNEIGATLAPSAYVLDRERMLLGQPARDPQRFTAPPLTGFGFQSLTPANIDGPAPPAGSPGYFMRHVDDELHSPLGADPSADFLEVYELRADFANPANSSFRRVQSVPVSDFDSDTTDTDPNGFVVPQPGTDILLDAIPQVIMYRLQYRNFGTHEALVGAFTHDVNGNDLMGIRWFELRKAPGSGQVWNLFQEGDLPAGDGVHRWMPAIGINKDSTIAVGYSVSNVSISPSLRLNGRILTDFPGVMSQGEITLRNGVGFHDNDRWGDYFAMVVDPVDDTTFWFSGEFARNGGWGTQIVSFTIPPPVPPPPPPPPPSQVISGVIFNDLDADGVRDAIERGLPGFLVYVDLDRDGRLDLNEPAVRTASDGSYSMPPLPADEYLVRQLAPPSWRQTFPTNRQPQSVTIDATGVDPDSADFGLTGGNLFDFGNNRGQRQTTLAEDGARAGVLPGFSLGPTVTGEVDAVANDVNDGVTFPSPLIAGTTGTANVTVSLNGQPRGLLQAFIDFNQDGDFSDANEQVIQDLRLGAGTTAVSFAIPANALTGQVNARFRYGWERGIGPTGPAMAGEVEDYIVNIFGDVPQAFDDTFSVEQDSQDNVLNVLVNDFPSSAGGLRIQSVTSPTTRGGTARVAADNQSIIYTPRSNFFGIDTFTYTITDASGRTDTARVTVQVEPTFDAPQAVDDQASVGSDTANNAIRVLDNDLVGANPPTRITAIPDAPDFGTASIDTGGTADPTDDVIRYTPDPSFSGVDQFTYRITDSVGASDIGTVTIFVGDTFDDDIVRYSVQITDMSNNPVSQIAVGDTFVVTVSVADIRTNVPPADQGVFAAFLDLLYPANIVKLNAPPVFNGEYQAVPEADTSVPGIIDEAGAFRNVGELPPGPGNKVVFRAAFTATATGVATIQTDPADDVLDPGPPPVLGNHDTLIYFPPSAVPIEDITYLGSSVIIISASGEGELHNYFSANDVNGDSRVTPFDALAIIAKLRGGSGEGEEGELAVPSAGRKYFYDTNNDRTVSTRDILSVVRYLAEMQASSVFNEEAEGEAVFGAMPGKVTTSLEQPLVSASQVVAIPGDALVIHVGSGSSSTQDAGATTKSSDTKATQNPYWAAERSSSFNYDEAIRQITESTDDEGDVDQNLLADLFAAWQRSDEEEVE